MVELEYHADQIDQHDIWVGVQHGYLTLDDVEEFRTEMESMVSNLKDELSSLEDKLDDALRELDEALPKCAECGEVLEDDNVDANVPELCADCADV